MNDLYYHQVILVSQQQLTTLCLSELDSTYHKISITHWVHNSIQYGYIILGNISTELMFQVFLLVANGIVYITYIIRKLL